MLLIAVILALPERMHKLLKFSIAIRIECLGFSQGAWPYFSFFHTSVLVDVTWRKAMFLA
jgi:hypothetical protein